MANLPLPGPLNLRQNQNNLDVTWKLWHRQWNNYAITTGLQDKMEDVQVATLLTCIGPEAMLILDGLCTSKEDQKTVASVITSEREARSEFLLIYTKNLNMSGRPAGRVTLLRGLYLWNRKPD